MKNLYLNNNANKLSLDSSSIDLIITHPPYFGIDFSRYGGNIKKQINYKNNYKKMLSELLKITKEAERVIKDTGNIFICIGPAFGMPYRYINLILNKTSLILKDTITFNYNDSNKEESMNTQLFTWFHLVKNINFAYENQFEIKKDSSSIYRCKANNMYHDVDKKLQEFFPNANLYDSLDIRVYDKIIKCYSKPKDIVLDMMGGTGVLAMAAISNNRGFIYNDISLLQLKIAKKRLEIFYDKNKGE